MEQKKEQDYIVRAMTKDEYIRAFAMTSTGVVEEARKRHNTSPVITAALGRLMTGGVMMGTMLKGEDSLITLQIRSAGPVKGITVTADSHGHVKGYAQVPDVILPANEKGKLDVGGAVFPGNLMVIQDIGLREPYVGEVQLQTGEIADDLTYYFASSEQIPSSVGLGVLMNKNNTVRKAGGFIIQLMPDTPDEIIDQLEKRISEVSSVTQLLEEGHTPESLLEHILGKENLIFNQKTPASFCCNCSHDRVKRALYSISRKDLQEMIDDGKDIEVKCHFCNSTYHFSVEELKQMAKEQEQ